ncbi:hypothetical protein PFISCL1PPCAC_8169, partial [Pristionchus fissidentatus]
EMDSGSIFLRLPHAFKPLQALNAVILFVCVASTGSAENGILWFVIVVSFLVSLMATLLFALNLQDQLLEKLTNGTISWHMVEMVYSFVVGVLCAISVWVAFGFANNHIGGTSAGFIATGLFLIVQTALYAVPCVMIYDATRREQQGDTTAFAHASAVEAAHPFSDRPYQ